MYAIVPFFVYFYLVSTYFNNDNDYERGIQRTMDREKQENQGCNLEEIISQEGY